MKGLKTISFLVTFSLIHFANFAQENSKTPFSENFETTFSIEVNADTSLDDLTQIEKMLKNDYNATIVFEYVKIVDKKIIALRMKLQNGNQSFMKSISNSNTPIDSFKINLKKIAKNQYYISIEDENALNSFNFFGRNSENMFGTQQIETDFFKMSDEMSSLFKEMEASQQRFRNLFNDLQNATETKKKVIENKEESSTTIISKEQNK